MMDNIMLFQIVMFGFNQSTKVVTCDQEKTETVFPIRELHGL